MNFKKLSIPMTLILIVILNGCMGKSKSISNTDTTPPVITINTHRSPVLVVYDTSFSIDTGEGRIVHNGVERITVQAVDDISGVITVETFDNVDYSRIGDYEIIYTATDEAGNISTETINVAVISPEQYPYWTNDKVLQKCIHSKLGISSYVDKPSIEKLHTIDELSCIDSIQNRDTYSPIKDLSALSELSNLMNLDLSGQAHINDISPLSNLDNLKKLVLKNTNTKLIKDFSSLANNANLTYLDLEFSNLDIQSFKTLSGLKNLKYLNATNNDMRIDDSIINFHLESLETLDISSNSIQDLSILSNLTNLKNLDISNQWQGFSDISVLSLLEKLEKLGLSGLRSVKDFSVLLQNTNLTDLDLSYSSLTSEAFSTLSGLDSLKYLNVSDNEIKNITGVHLESLEILSLSNNFIEDLSPLSNLTKLKELYLHNSYLDDFSRIPNGVESLGDLNQLEVLALTNSKLEDNDLIFLFSLNKLVHLNLNRNNLRDSQIFSTLLNLETLDIGQNKFISIDNLSELLKLKSISIYYNCITNFTAFHNLDLNIEGREFQKDRSFCI